MKPSDHSARSFSADRLRAALGDVGGSGLPNYLDDIVSRAGHTRQRPAWTFLERWLSLDIAAPNQGVPRAVVVVGVLAVLLTLLAGVLYVGSLRLQPERPPVLSLGIFESVAGRIVFDSPGSDRGFGAGLWAVDPAAPSVSNLVRLGPEGDRPLAWTRDGTGLLFMRVDPTYQGLCCPRHLYILRADGSETRLNTDAMYPSGAAISPDGSLVAFGEGPYRGPASLYVIDVAGGQPVRIAETGQSPTFSPDGTQIAYVVLGPTGAQVWVANADGTDARLILSGEDALIWGGGDFAWGPSLAWSPTGDRIAIVGLEDVPAIYTVAADGSDFKKVITGGTLPYWSPDGSLIAYSIPNVSTGEVLNLAIANADGSHVREFDFGASGPWHPGTLGSVDRAPVDEP